MALTPSPDPAALSSDERRILLSTAREAIRRGCEGKPARPEGAPVPEGRLAERRATFVTLEKRGQLRGCIGMLEAVRPLLVDVAENARAAAFEDPRFPPVAPEELDPDPAGRDLLRVRSRPVAPNCAGRRRADPAGRPAARHISAERMGATSRPPGLSRSSENEGRPASRLLVGYSPLLPLSRAHRGILSIAKPRASEESGCPAYEPAVSRRAAGNRRNAPRRIFASPAESRQKDIAIFPRTGHPRILLAKETGGLRGSIKTTYGATE